jgi:hypothetical protein
MLTGTKSPGNIGKWLAIDSLHRTTFCVLVKRIIMSKFLALPADWIRISDVSRLLKIPYQSLIRAVMSGEVSAERMGNGRGYYATRRDSLRTIAGHFGARFDAPEGRA